MVEFYDALITLATEMSELDVLDKNHYFCLSHMDLEPQNILVGPISSAQSRAITGIIDWDLAIFGPPFMSCKPPMWLWAWNDKDVEDECLANNTPSTPELCELKQLFEDAAGPMYRQFAYDAKYRLARKLMHFAINGSWSNEDYREWQSLMAEWKEVRAGLELERLENFPSEMK